MKKPFRVGAITGGFIGVGIALGMDLILGQSPGGGWNDAVAHDINKLFNTSFSSDHIIVIIGVVMVISVIGAFGAIAGGFFVTIITRFFEVLTKDE